MKSNGGEWTWDALATYLHDPKTALPGNKMAFPGIRDDAELADVLPICASSRTRRSLASVGAASRSAGLLDSVQTGWQYRMLSAAGRRVNKD
jgi:hypothetical protein